MRKLLNIAGVLAALSLGAAGQAVAATTLSVGWNSSCGDATCFNPQNVFTETFQASAFSGPVNISQLLLSRSVLGSMDGHMFNLSFTIGGQSVGTWGDWNMGAVAGDDLTFTGSAFDWNPNDGDLVLVLELVAPNGEKLGANGGGGGFSFDTDPPPQSRSAPDQPDGNPDPGADNGPSDDTNSCCTYEGAGFEFFSFRQAAVPEPATWALMLSGFGLCGSSLRRRRRTATA